MGSGVSQPHPAMFTWMVFSHSHEKTHGPKKQKKTRFPAATCCNPATAWLEVQSGVEVLRRLHLDPFLRQWCFGIRPDPVLGIPGYPKTWGNRRVFDGDALLIYLIREYHWNIILNDMIYNDMGILTIMIYQ